MGGAIEVNHLTSSKAKILMFDFFCPLLKMLLLLVEFLALSGSFWGTSTSSKSPFRLYLALILAPFDPSWALLWLIWAPFGALLSPLRQLMWCLRALLSFL